MAKNEMAAGAEQVLAHGTARTRRRDEAAGAAKHEAGEKDGGKHAAGKKKIKRMIVEPADDGSHIITHEHHQPEDVMAPGHRDEHYTAANTEALHDHIEEHLGQANPGEEESETGQEQAAEEQQAAEHGGESEAQA